MSNTANALLLGSDKLIPNNTTASLVVAGIAFSIIMIFCIIILVSYPKGTPMYDYAKGVAIGLGFGIVFGAVAYWGANRFQFTRNNPEAAAKLYMAENTGNAMRYMNPLFSIRS